MLEFRPKRGPGDLLERNIKIRAESPAASSLLVFQAVFPFLLFAGNDSDEPIELEISGGTNVSFSLSYEYLDQVLLPTLENWFGIRIERRLDVRGWSSGTSRGSVWFKIYPLGVGQTLKPKENPNSGSRPRDSEIRVIDVSIVAPSAMHNELQASLQADLQELFPRADFNLVLVEDSKHEARIYVLLVARSETLRWGRDNLYQGRRKGNTTKQLSAEISKAVSEKLHDEVMIGGIVDEHLQDQLAIFQALAEGQTSFPRGDIEAEDDEVEERLRELRLDEGLRKDRVKGPLGDPKTDSNHTRTARWVTFEVLEPKVSWFNKGKVCKGVALASGGGDSIVKQ